MMVWPLFCDNRLCLRKAVMRPFISQRTWLMRDGLHTPDEDCCIDGELRENPPATCCTSAARARQKKNMAGGCAKRKRHKSMLQNAKEDLRSATFWHLCNLMQHTAANMETWIMLNGMDLTIYYGRIWICQETKTQSDFNVLSVSFTDANILEQPDKTTRSVWCSKYLFFVGRHQLRLNITCIIFLSNYSKYIQSLCCESVLHIVHEVKN